jgi:hypothetical protein
MSESSFRLVDAAVERGGGGQTWAGAKEIERQNVNARTVTTKYRTNIRSQMRED